MSPAPGDPRSSAQVRRDRQARLYEEERRLKEAEALLDRQPSNVIPITRAKKK